jgi:hypothetical protein
MKEVLMKIAGGLGPIKVFWDKLTLTQQSAQSEKDKEYALSTLVAKAHRDWLEAQALFNEVKEPDLIDHAIYAMEATERKYRFLLKQAKQEKAINEDIHQFLN